MTFDRYVWDLIYNPERNKFALYVMALKPILRRVALVGYVSLMVAVAAAALGCAVLSAQVGGEPGQSWIGGQIQNHDKRLDEVEKATTENTRVRSVVEQRLRENDRWHSAVDAQRLGERLAALEQTSSYTLAFQGAIFVILLGLLFEAFDPRFRSGPGA